MRPTGPIAGGCDYVTGITQSIKGRTTERKQLTSCVAQARTLSHKYAPVAAAAAADIGIKPMLHVTLYADNVFCESWCIWCKMRPSGSVAALCNVLT